MYASNLNPMNKKLSYWSCGHVFFLLFVSSAFFGDGVVKPLIVCLSLEQERAWRRTPHL